MLRREMLRQPAGSVVTEALLREYEYDAIETCAGDGSCALACPVGINTGVLMKQFRHTEHNHTEEYIAKKIAEHWATAERGARAALRLNHLATTVYGGSLLAESALTAARAVVSKDLMPGWLPNIPPVARPEVPATARDGAAAVYFHACVNRIFGDADQEEKQPTKLKVLSRVDSVAVHPVCSIHHLGLVEKLQALGEALAEHPVTPIYATCCAFAGDRGFLHPELTHSATKEEVEELGDQHFDKYIGSNRTCELGMNLATGKDYRSVIFLLEAFTRA